MLYSAAGSSIAGAGRDSRGDPFRRGRGASRCQGRSLPSGSRPGSFGFTLLLTDPRLPPEPDGLDQRGLGTLGPERPGAGGGEDPEERTRGREPRSLCEDAKLGGGERMQSGGSERPWEDHGTPSPTPSLRKTSGNFPSHLVPAAWLAQR